MNDNKFIYTILFVGLISILGLTFFLNPSPNTITGMATYSGSGAGTEADPFIITTCLELNETRDNLTANYELGVDIDMSAAGCEAFQTGSGFEPIGNSTNPFTGNLDGNNFAINNLFINRSTEYEVAIFKYIEGSDIINLKIFNANVTGRSYVAILSGVVKGNSLLSNLNLSGNVYQVGTSDNMAGGLSSQAENSEIENSYVDVDIIANDMYIGGLFGDAYNVNITNCSFQGIIEGFRYAGGFVGHSNGYVRIEDSYTEGNITTTGVGVGGLIGDGDNIFINNSYSNSKISGLGSAGGLVGYVGGSISNQILNSYATGDVSGDFSVGGFIGQTSGSNHLIEKSYATGDITGTSSSTGGFIGSNSMSNSQILNCYSRGNVDSVDSVGGFIGVFGSVSNQIINNSYATGNVTASGDYIGGFAGDLFAVVSLTISNSYSTGSVNFPLSATEKGGFLGEIYTATLENIYWYNRSDGLNCYNAANVNCNAIDTESYFFDYDNEPMLLTAGTGWDFINTWSNHYNAANYVTLAFQHEEVVVVPPDSTAPTITVLSPTNTTYTTSTIWFNATANEAVDTWTLNYNGTNTTITINTSATLSNGQYQLLLYGNDSSGNVGLNDSIWFTVSVASSTTEEDDDSSSSSSTTTVTEYINQHSIDDSTFKIIVKIPQGIPKIKKIIDHKDTNIEEITIETNEYTYGEIEIVNLNKSVVKCIMPAEYRDYEVYKSVGVSSGISPNKINRIGFRVGIDSTWKIPLSAIRIIRCPDIKPITPDEEEIPELTIEETSDGSYKISSNKITGFSIIALTNPVASESQEQSNNTVEPEVIEYEEEEVIEEEVQSCSKFLGMCNYIWLILILILIGAGIYFKNKKN